MPIDTDRTHPKPVSRRSPYMVARRLPWYVYGQTGEHLMSDTMNNLPVSDIGSVGTVAVAAASYLVHGGRLALQRIFLIPFASPFPTSEQVRSC